MKQTFLHSMYFKSIILSYEEDELIEMLDQNDDPLDAFITLLYDTAEVDPSFFALDDSIINKIQSVLNKYRFDGKHKDEETIDTINDMIIFCNEVKAFSREDKDKIYLSYIRNQSVQRQQLMYYPEDLFEAISMDAVVYESVKENSRIDNPYIRDNIVSTTNYLLQNYFPLVLESNYYNNLKVILADDSTLDKKDKKRAKRLLKTMKSMESII